MVPLQFTIYQLNFNPFPTQIDVQNKAKIKGVGEHTKY